jgi:nickel-dependent lactate racemase
MEVKYMKLKYGNQKLTLDTDRIPKIKTLLPQEKQGVNNPQQVVKESLDQPIGEPPLREKINRQAPDKVVIVVNDVSRPTPYDELLPPLLEELHGAGIKKSQITFLIATGIHDPNTEEQNKKIFGSQIIDNYRLISHDPDNGLVELGELSSGNDLAVNKEVVEADLLITTGVIAPHYFAGFSGGRKSILPGVAGRESIEFNHSRMVDLLGNLPPIDENPISQEMLEAAEKVGVNFILNVVTNSKKEIVEVVAGDLRAAWKQGVNTSADMYHVPLEEKADVAIVSAGGYPKDINMYQAQKALDNANFGVKEGGTIILAAECRAGLGEDTFTEWVKTSNKPEDNSERIKKHFVLGGHKAFAISKVVLEKEFILLSSLAEKVEEQLFATSVDSLEEALDIIENKHGTNYNCILMPQGGLTVPVVKD